MSQSEILAKVAKGELTPEAAAQMLAKAAEKPLSCKVSAKGALSVYGLQRMPVTLYAGQWERLLDFADNIQSFIKANPSLKRKDAA